MAASIPNFGLPSPVPAQPLPMPTAGTAVQPQAIPVAHVGLSGNGIVALFLLGLLVAATLGTKGSKREKASKDALVEAAKGIKR